MGFFRDLFGPRRPCDICQLNQESWPAARCAVVDWKIRGHGLKAKLFICGPCYQAIEAADLREKNPALVLALLSRAGHAKRPPIHVYLQHPEWRKIWMHSLDMAGVSIPDESTALQVIKELEAQIFESVD